MDPARVADRILSGSVSTGLFCDGVGFLSSPRFDRQGLGRAEKMTFECNFFLIPVWDEALTGWPSGSK
jgi:hypothetical protein